MGYARGLRDFLVAMTMLVIGSICFVRIGSIDLHSIVATGKVLVPAVVIIGLLAQKMGEIIDNPNNRADADYKLAVLNALKKMDKSITLQELNEKLTRTVAEPDAPDSDTDEDVDV